MEVIKVSDFNNHKIDESQVIRRVIAGEKELFEILIRRNNQKLYRVIRSYIKDEAEIEDLIQNTHIKAFEKLYQFKHTSAYSTWLIRIGINESLARLRDKGKLHAISDQSQDFESNAILEMPNKDQLNPERRIIREEAKRLLENAIDNLDSKYKAPYVLKEIEEMSIKEISDCLDLSISNVKVRIHRAKAILKEELYDLSKNRDVFEFGFSRCDRITEFVMGSIK